MLKTLMCSALLALGLTGAALAQAPMPVGALPAIPPDVAADPSTYVLGPFDKITVSVFGQKDLSVEKTQIDSAGSVVLPLVGAVQAGGKTPAQLSREVEAKLSENYLVSPHVSVLIDESISQRVTVSGNVTEPGVFPLKGRTTLLQVVAMAKGANNRADRRHVAVFRTVAGKNARAVFDLSAIEQGKAADPEVMGGDSIVVEGSNAKIFFRELISALPAIGVFGYF